MKRTLLTEKLIGDGYTIRRRCIYRNLRMPSARPSIAGAIKPRAVLIGGLADLFGTIMAGFVLMNAYAITRIAGGALTLEDLERNGGLDFLQMYLGDSLVLVANLLLGLLMTAVGGYVAARLAGGVLPLFHGLLAGMASLVGGLSTQ